MTSGSAIILHVDNESSYLNLIKIHLEKQNPDLQIESIISPSAALKKLKTREYDVIIINFQMSEMTGLELLKKIRETGNHTPCIMLAGNTKKEIVIQALNLGADYYLEKETDPNILFTELQQAIQIITRKKKQKGFHQIDIAGLFQIQNNENRSNAEIFERIKILQKAISTSNLIEEGILTSENIYREFLDNMAKGFWVNDKEDIIFYANKSFEVITGISSEELMGQQVLEFSKETLNIFMGYYLKAKETLKPIHFDGVPFISPAGHFSYQSGWLVPKIKNNSFDGMVCSFENITKHKLIEEELQKSQDLLKKTFLSLNASIFIIDESTGKIIDCNPEIFGYSRQEILGRTLDFLHIEEKTIEKFRNVHQAVEKSYPLLPELQMKRKDGTIFPVEYTVISLEEEENTPVRWMIVVRDITERKLAERRLREYQEHLEYLVQQRTDDLEKVNELLSRQKDEIALYLDIITHDLKNYHMTAKGYLDLVLEKTSANGTLLKKANSFILRAETLVKNISVLMRNKMTYSYELSQVNLFDAITRCEGTLLELFPTKKIEIKVKAPSESCILADSLFDGLLLNLLTNVVKNDPHEVVKIEIELKPTREGSKCLLSITDYGTGIAPEQRPGIFERFTEFRKKGQGSGLGMFIVKTLVKRYRGNIWIESRVPDDYTQGTRVIIGLQHV
ncbi:MAG: PAS domain S-box protein [Promethearchaeota archaeon]